MSTESVPVLFPPPGETLRLWPLCAKPSWYRVHTGPDGAPFPCPGENCLAGCGADFQFTQRWEGYMLCLRADRPGALLVARLTPGLWDHCAALSSPTADHRESEWVYGRRRTRGNPSLTLDILEMFGQRPAPARDVHTCDHLWGWWQLPEEMPDYRAAVHALGDGSAWPGSRPPPGSRRRRVTRKEHYP